MPVTGLQGGTAPAMHARAAHDHKPDDPEEATRIYSAGLDVQIKRHGGVPRVNGSLAMSRALGDVKYKCVCMYLHVCGRICVCVRARACMCTCMCVCVHVHVPGRTQR